MGEWFSENYEWIVAAIIYALERYTAFRSKAKKQKQTQQEHSQGSVVTAGDKPKRKAVDLLFDILPIVSRIRDRDRKGKG